MVPPPVGAVVTAPPPAWTSVFVNGATQLDCGGARYTRRYRTATGHAAVDRCDGEEFAGRRGGRRRSRHHGFKFSSAYYQPFYSSSSAIYDGSQAKLTKRRRAMRSHLGFHFIIERSIS